MTELFCQPIIATGVETALLVAGLVATAAGAGVGAYSSIKQGEAANDAAKATQQSEKRNAQAASDAAALEAGQVRRKNMLRLGSQRAAAAKSGVMIDDSAADVIYDSSIQGELEALSVLYSGASQAGYYRSRGNIAAMEGKNAKSAGYLRGGATLIGGLGAGANQAAPMFKSTGSYGTTQEHYGNIRSAY
jgi:hypothetical protein